VHKGWLGDGGGCKSLTLLLGLADLRIALCKLKPDCLREVRIETDTLLQKEIK